MELISRLTRIALEMAHEYCLIDWHPDDEPPETYEAELQIEYMPGLPYSPSDKGDFFLLLNDTLHCQVSAATMTCWTASDLRPYHWRGVLPYER